MIFVIRLREIMDSNGRMWVKTGRNGLRKSIARNLLILLQNNSLRMTWTHCAHVMSVCWYCRVGGLPIPRQDGLQERENL